LRHTLHEGGLARTQLALQADEIPGLDQSAETNANAPCLFGTAADEIEAMFVENGHG
jgi:hypothetical protein